MTLETYPWGQDPYRDTLESRSLRRLVRKRRELEARTEIEALHEMLEEGRDTGGYLGASMAVLERVGSLADESFDMLMDALNAKSQKISDGTGYWSDLTAILANDARRRYQPEE